MSIIAPEIEIVDRASESIRYLEHGWPTELCRWHTHKEYELHLVVATRGKAFVGDYIGDFQPGALFLTGPNLPHNWITDEVWTEPVDVRDMMVQFDHPGVEKLAQAFGEFGELRPMLDMAQSGIEFIGFDADVARKHLETIRDARGTRRIMEFLSFLLEVNNWPHKEPLSVLKLFQPEGSRKQARIGQVVDNIVENFADDISLDAAARMAGMSPTTFSRNFQSVTGNRFVEFVNRVRIGQACSMLYATEEQISSICFGVGFQNLANFNRHFLKMKGMTPSQFRDTARGELMRQTEGAR